jgi:Fe-S cluster biogenesis protein NfuA/nitrite reductase/ring-hydroxylating ferredoxin subunit
MATVLQLYGSGLERIIGGILASGPDGARIASELAEDPLVATLLLIHDLHPISLEERVQAALDSVRPYMDSHGGNVELLSLDRGVARIRLQGSCSDCSASSVTLELAIKQALEQSAPDLDGLEVEGVVEQESPPANGGAHPVSIVSAGAAARAPTWVDLDRLDVPAGEMVAADVAGSPLVIANVDGTLLAYRDACAACGGALHGGELQEGALRCPACARTFFLPRAGRSMDDERLQLEPVPLLHEDGSVKVAVAT